MANELNEPSPADLLFEALQGLSYNDFISHADIDRALGIPLPKYEDDNGKPLYASMQDYVSDVRKRDLYRLDQFVAARDRLLIDEQKMLISVPGQGYRIEMPNEQTETALDMFAKRATKALAVAMQQVANVNLALLNHEEQTRNAMAQAKLGAIKGMVNKRTLTCVDKKRLTGK